MPHYSATRLRLVFLIAVILSLPTIVIAQSASKATWIWNPGDFDIWLSNQLQVKRTERNVPIPTIWRMYSHQPQVNFAKQLNLSAPEEINISVEGIYNVAIDGSYVQTDQHHITIPAGKHSINVQVFNQSTPPSIFVQGTTIVSDTSWTVGTVPGKAGSGPNASCWNFNSAGNPPSAYKLSTIEEKATNTKRSTHSVLVDFGKETIGFVKLKNLKGNGKVTMYYGESQEEALSTDSCETLDKYTINNNNGDFTADHSRALRFVNIQYDEGISFDDVLLLYEYLPLTNRGSFKSSDAEVNKIWEVAIRTLELNTREFFLDGIKRDHWVWSGDAVQSFLMNYYSFFDNDVVKRTTWALRGADPVEMHINTILDYSLYWFSGIYDYYLYTGDEAFLKSIYPRMVTLMDFVLNRRNNNGMLEGLPGDWVFVDWAPMAKDGELSIIQILFARSLETMGVCASLMKDGQKEAEYKKLAVELKSKITANFWDPNKQVFISGKKNGIADTQVTRYPNMFAMMFGYLDPAKTASVKNNVLMNDSVQKIPTPYMRFYELAALAEIGQQTYVTKEIKDYWGGMIKEGATTFWEQYYPEEKGAARYAMYGRPFGRSLCHAWGASPIYLLGKYYLGVKPLQPGYATYLVEPNLGGLQWIDGKVPTPQGDISVFADTKQIKVTAVAGKGVLRFKSAKKPSSKSGVITSAGNNIYEMALENGKAYVVNYSAVK